MDQATSQPMPEITATELKKRLDNGEDIQIVDVREANEVAVAKLPNSIHIPLAQVLNRVSEIDPARETVVHCKMGGRSAKAIEALKRSGFTGNLLNLKGGITAWSNEVDPSVPKYRGVSRFHKGTPFVKFRPQPVPLRLTFQQGVLEAHL